jgi:hypothetical protein
MARPKKYKVFVSYSRHDEALVKPLAGMLGVAANDAVFLDVTTIQPGALWEQEIIGAIKQSSVFVLCWCCECEHSSFIAREISTALKQGNKRMVPVLFCSTPLPPTMADRQWINLTGQVVHHCTHAHQTPSDTAPPAPAAAPPPAPTLPSAAKAVFNIDIPIRTPLVAPAYAPSSKSSIGKLTLAAILIALAVRLIIKYGPNIKPSIWITIAIAAAICALVAIPYRSMSLAPNARLLRNIPPPDEDQIAEKARDYFQNLGKKQHAARDPDQMRQ